MLTSHFGLGAPRGRHLGPTSSLSPPPQPSNESIARTMWRNLVILAVIIYCALIAGILFLLWR
jgi:hypothetical protein